MFSPGYHHNGFVATAVTNEPKSAQQLNKQSKKRNVSGYK